MNSTKATTVIEHTLEELVELVHDEVVKERGCDSRHNGLICTRRANHPGLHIADDGTQICAVWMDIFND